VFAVSETVDAFYTLSHVWTEDVCALETSTRTCVTRVTPSFLSAIAYGFLITALSLDRLRATLAMPALMLDRTPRGIIGAVLLGSAVVVGGMFIGALVDDRPMAMCAAFFLLDERTTSMQLAPLVATYMCNLVVMSFVGRRNALIYERFMSVHERQSLAMRAQLKRNMATSRSLTPAIAMVAFAFAVLASAALTMNALGASALARHLADHSIHAVVLSTNALFAVIVLRMHDNLRATMKTVLSASNKVTPLIVLPIKTTAPGADGDKYHASLYKSWKL